ncbi:lytic transglycosylase domain-containing protein [Arthrobacter sp. E3]|uniref:aggregation-promoting factor C-terminal-like domain-containing protein n=1 Tax=Arthrobacter sp. E3 TaxID=517402 RepID=UPI001A94A301|nr:lytic transglycosylase domain-containing protein [Arthrobacter sp. E3]
MRCRPQAQDAPPSGSPSWADVEAATGNVAATAGVASKIAQALDALECEADIVGTTAVQAGADYAMTQNKLDAATVEVDVLNAQAQRAAEQAQKYKKEAVAVAVHNYKHGGIGLGLFATMAALESLDSLNGVDLMQRVGDQSARRHELAGESQAAAAALEKNRQAAQTAQMELSAAALRTRDTAVAAHATVSLQLESKKSQSTTLVAQLAALNNTSVAKEQEYRRGQTELAAYEQAQAAKRDAAAAQAQRAAQIQQLPAAPNPGPNPVIANPAPNPGLPAPVPGPIKPVTPPAPVAPNPGGGYIPVEELLPNIPSGATNDPAGAKAYVASRLAAHGWDQEQFQCLNQLWERESNWRTNATNPSSGAYGIAQALPPGKYGEVGSDWLNNYQTQIT